MKNLFLSALALLFFLPIPVHGDGFDRPGTGQTFVGNSTLCGTLNGNTFVQGDGTITCDTTVNGNLFTTGSLINHGGYNLTVNGDLTVYDVFNFTPTLTSTLQKGVYIAGQFIFGVTANDSQFKINAVSDPNVAFLSVAGDMIGGTAFEGFDEVNFDISANTDEADALAVVVGGDMKLLNITGTGGDSAGVANAGGGSGIDVAGVISNCDFVLTGGNSSFSGFNAGHGGHVGGFPAIYLHQTLNLKGGSAGTSSGNTIAGGGGGSLQASIIEGEKPFNPTIDISGGDADSGFGGASGPFNGDRIQNVAFTANSGNSAHGSCNNHAVWGGALIFENSSLTAKGGNGATNGGNGLSFTSSGNSHFTTINLSGGNGTAGTGGNGGSLTVSGNLFSGNLTTNGGNGGTAGGSGGSLTLDGVWTRSNGATLSQSAGTGGTGVAGGFTVRGALTLNESTGSGSAALGSNSPATTNTAPYTWLKFTSKDGSTVYVPAFK